jgi:hypothetical protein
MTRSSVGSPDLLRHFRDALGLRECDDSVAGHVDHSAAVFEIDRHLRAGHVIAGTSDLRSPWGAIWILWMRRENTVAKLEVCWHAINHTLQAASYSASVFSATSSIQLAAARPTSSAMRGRTPPSEAVQTAPVFATRRCGQLQAPAGGSVAGMLPSKRVRPAEP